MINEVDHQQINQLCTRVRLKLPDSLGSAMISVCFNDQDRSDEYVLQFLSVTEGKRAAIDREIVAGDIRRSRTQ